MRVLLVDPPGKNKGFNTGLGYLCAALKANHAVHILDLNNLRPGVCGAPNPDVPLQDIQRLTTEAIDSFRPNIVGASVKTFTAETCRSILACVRVHAPTVKTIVGGPHVTLDGARYVAQDRIDFGLRGESERSFAALCAALEARSSLAGIPGLLHWTDKKLVENAPASEPLPPDELPFPSYDEFSSVIASNGIMKEYPLLTSRGCPYRCSYCSMPRIMGRKWRGRSARGVVDELVRAKAHHGSTSFTVVDDNLTLDLKRIDQLCDLLLEEKVGLTWNSQNGIRADRIDSALARKMHRAGCRAVWVGIESADETVFNSIDKGEKLEDIAKGIGVLQSAGIRVGGFFMVGLPLSTQAADMKSIEFVKNLGIDAWWFYFVPYPNTWAFEWVTQHGRLLRPIEGALQFGSANIEPIFETDDYTRQQRIDTYEHIHFRMGFVDRLFDPSVSTRENMRALSQTASRHGAWARRAFMRFRIRYAAKHAARRTKRLLAGTAR